MSASRSEHAPRGLKSPSGSSPACSSGADLAYTYACVSPTHRLFSLCGTSSPSLCPANFLPFLRSQFGHTFFWKFL